MDTEPQSKEFPQKNISPIINVENGDKKTQVAIQEVDSLFQDINQYNDKFSLGASMFSLLKQHLENTDGNEEKKPLTNNINEESQHMSASALDVMHQATLNNLGLALEPVSGKDVTIFTSEGATGTGEMRLNIKDRSQFSSFLKGLEINQVTETPLNHHLKSLTDILNQQILDNYNLQEPDDNTLSFLGSLDNIVSEYNRLGLKEEAQTMEEYLTHAREGNLREFIALRTSGLMQEPNKGFGPADWQKDASPTYLKNHWDEAIRLLRTLRNNPKAMELYNQLFTHLNKCLPLAQTSLEELEYLTPEDKVKLAEILKDARDGLSGFEI